jgi:hypothetical protein
MKTRLDICLLSVLLGGCAAHVVRSITPGEVVPPPAASKRVVARNEGFLSPFHQAHAGQIVLSTSPIPRDAAPADVVTTFDASTPVWPRLYLSDSAANLAGDECGNDRKKDRFLFAEVGGQSVSLDYSRLTDPVWQEATTYSIVEPRGQEDVAVPLFDGKPLPTDSSAQQLRYNYINLLLPLLHDGDNPVRFSAIFRCNTDNNKAVTVAATDVIIRLSPAIRAQLIGAMDKVMATSSLPARMEPLMLQPVVSQYRSLYTVERVSAEGRWQVEYERINGRPLRRVIDGKAFLRRRDGTGCEWLGVTYIQQSIGEGRFEDSMTAMFGDRSPIQCAALAEHTKTAK